MYVNKSLVNEEDGYVTHDQHETVGSGSLQTLRTTTRSIAIVISVAAVLLDLVLIIIIKRYKALKTRNNQYLLHYALCNILYLCSNSILHLVMDVFFDGFLWNDWYCSFVQLENYFLNLSIIFIAMYLLDEYIRVSCKETFLISYMNGYQYFIGCIYVLHLILVFIISSICFNTTKTIKFDLSFIMVTITYGLLLLAILRIIISVKRESFDSQTQLLKIVLEVTKYVFLFFLPMIVYYNLLNILEANKIKDVELWTAFAFITEFIAYSTTFILTYKLIKLNKFFKLAFCKVLCKSKKDLDYSRLDTVPEELSNK